MKSQQSASFFVDKSLFCQPKYSLKIHLQITAEELDRLYTLLGKGILHLQYVEDALNTLITIKHEIREPGIVSLVEAKVLLAKHQRNTLGTSLKIARENNFIERTLLERLSN